MNSTSSANSPVLLSTQDLGMKVGTRVLAQGLSWQVQRGECWCIIGRNGAGKSTLLRTLAGMRDIQVGKVLLQDKNLPIGICLN